ncbi:conserved Plasmodium protein, unknown function [Plasmodium ovale]|uniref:Uncharacterized protein n=2 Tax=Plasmodium ovale TaxID=36330 RepID=A0A1A8VYY6_PLAOA|nr:conserved Plasmodium protein, unknown function [Plasmodium ovale curtisi]SBS93507.1 conserved Plasmodium protein, unknown function [Plasmodium ovale curtisi]SCP04852.1 conserved Plasmodium protein, unknown function [Plasmodium ovale]
MHIKELLYNELIILKITEFLTILEIQNLIISLKIDVKTNLYFARECLSLLSLKPDEGKNMPQLGEDVDGSYVESDIGSDSGIGDVGYNDHGSVVDIDCDGESESTLSGASKSDANGISENEINFLAQSNGKDENMFGDLDEYMKFSSFTNEENNSEKSKKKNFKQVTDIVKSNKGKKNDCSYCIIKIGKIIHKIKKNIPLSINKIKEYLNVNNNDKVEKGETHFNKMWLYFHIRNDVIDVNNEYKNGFFKIKINNFVNRNNKLHFDIFTLYKFNGYYSSIFEIPWISVYFKLALNSICIFCNARVSKTSNCLIYDKLNLRLSNKILLDHFNKIANAHTINHLTVNENSIKIKQFFMRSKKNDRNNEENNNHIYNKRRKLGCGNNQSISSYNDHIDRNNNTFDGEEEIEFYAGEKINEFFYVKKTHVFCSECEKLMDYKSSILSVYNKISEDIELLKKLKLSKINLEIPGNVSSLCNYFFFKDKCIEFFKEISKTLQKSRKFLVKQMNNHFIFSFTITFYKYIIRPLLACKDNKILEKENIFLFGFYVKYKNLLNLFSSPRVLYVYFSFKLIFEKIKMLYSWFNNKHFVKISKRLHFETLAIIEKYNRLKTKILYTDISRYLYDHLNDDMLSNTGYSEMYVHFFQCLQNYKFV